MYDTNSKHDQLNRIIKKANRGMLSYQRLGLIDEYEQQMVEVKQYWAYLIYNNSHTMLIKDTLRTRYTNAWKDLDRFVAPVWNPLKRVANIKAQTYSRPPVRRTENKTLQVLISKNAKRINRAMTQASKLLNATGNVCIWPILGTRGGLPVVLDILVIPAHDTYLTENYNDYKYDIVSKHKDYYLVSVYTGESVDNERQNFCVHKNKNNTTSPFAAVCEPIWVSLNDTNFGNPRSVDQVSDLITGTLDIGQLEAMSGKVVFLKSFKQLQRTNGEKVSVDKLEASPHVLWPENVDAIDLVDKDFAFEAYVECKAVSLASQHGVSKMAMTGDYKDDQSWSSVSQELLHHWEEQIELWKFVEDQMWASIQNTELLQDDFGPGVVSVAFMQPYPNLQDPKVEWELHLDKVKNGVSTTTDRMMMEHPHLTSGEEADAMWEGNLRKYSIQVNFMRELNLSGGKSPEENGADGAAAKQKAFGKLGAEGPSVDGKVTEVDHIQEADHGN